jgi:hypothetical protein
MRRWRVSTTMYRSPLSGSCDANGPWLSAMASADISAPLVCSNPRHLAFGAFDHLQKQSHTHKNNVNSKPQLAGVTWGVLRTWTKAHPPTIAPRRQDSTLMSWTFHSQQAPYRKRHLASWGWGEAFGLYSRVLKKTRAIRRPVGLCLKQSFLRYCCCYCKKGLHTISLHSWSL